ncbi:MAG: carbohydrate kinase family protein [Candidatus Bathyarchaeota archaeon]|nr:MAG: carbohydrate kinase family protein [Candidatus Bathyarchaeota archaeon]
MSTPLDGQPMLVFVGHISIDKVVNLNGSRIQPGGGALYSAIAAKTLNCNIALISAIGKDYAFTEWLDSFDSSCIKTYNMPTTRFHIRYDKNWVANYIEASSGAGARITSSLIPTKLLTRQNLIHLSPMKPTKVVKIVDNIRQRDPSMEVSISTWIGYTKKARHRQVLAELASQVDFFMLNEFELKALTQTSDLPLALERLRARRFVVTLGKFGAITGGEGMDTQMVPALTVPTEKTIDTTGAGDTWNGAFLAMFKRTKDLMKSVTAGSIISSIKCTKWGFDALRNLKFKKPSDLVEYVLALKDGSLQKRISDLTYHEN